MQVIKQTQKLRVIANGFSVYTTAKQVRNGLGDSVQSNTAIQNALDALSKLRADGACGIAGNWNGMSVQVDMV